MLLNASIIGAAAVTLGTSYAFGDFFGAHHSLHRSFFEAKGFYTSFAGLVAVAAAIVLIPHAPLGLITVAVQALAGRAPAVGGGVPAAAVQRPGSARPWVNRLWLNAVTTLVIGVLLVMSLILIVTTVFPGTDVTILAVVLGGSLVVTLGVSGAAVARRRPSAATAPAGTPGPPGELAYAAPGPTREARVVAWASPGHAAAERLPGAGRAAPAGEGGPARFHPLNGPAAWASRLCSG